MTAFRATYSDWKLIKTRGVVQVVMEVPLADADAAYDVLGGMPVHGKERWFGIAALKSPAEEARATPDQEVPPSTRPDRAKRPWRDLDPTTQAGMHCNDAIFAAFLRETRPNLWRETPDAAACVRAICSVVSRKELSTNHKARVIWKQLDDQFQAWKALEHA
jgi:hypothetical protein